MAGGVARLRTRARSLTTRQRIMVSGAFSAIVVLSAVAAVVAGSAHHPKTRIASTGLAPHEATLPRAKAATPVRRRPRPKPIVVPSNVAPLTGLVVGDRRVLRRPALVVKIDNLDTARASALPQTGLNQADIVFEEVVEADITRLVAVFHSTSADPVGPVRSARTTDVHLLPQLHTPLLAWSGGNGGVIAAIRGADVVDVGAATVPGAYFRDNRRRAPHNFYVHPDVLWRHARPGEGPPTSLFTYRRRPGAPAPAHAVPAKGLSITWGPGGASAPVSYRWNPLAHGWDRTQRGRPDVDASGARIAPANVVVLVTAYRPSPADARSPEAITVGSGEAFVFTSGRVAHGRWTRRTERSAPALVDDSGRPITLAPGRTWVELPRTGSVTTIR